MTFVLTTQHFPPPLNSLFRNVTSKDGKRKGRITTQRYGAWRSAVGWDFRKAQTAYNNPPPMQGPVAVTIELVKPDMRKRDIDGLAKALLDQLTEHQVIADDSQIEDLRLCYVESERFAARICVWPIEERAAA